MRKKQVVSVILSTVQVLVPVHTELRDSLQLSLQSVLDHFLHGLPLGRMQRFDLLQPPQDSQVTALHLTVSGLQESTLQPIRGQEKALITVL